MPNLPAVQPAPKKKRLRTKRNKLTGVVVVAGTNNEPKGHEVKAGSKPASSSSTTKPVLMLHATTVSKPPTSTSAPPFSSRLQLLPFSSISTAFPTTANKQSGNKEQRNFQKREPAVKAVQSSHTEAPIPALIDQYFTRAEFRGFRYNPTNPFISEFNRLSIMMGWDKYPEVRKLRYLIFTEVLATQFNVYYGVDAGELKPWQDLCQALRLDPIPNTLKHARDSVRTKHVSIIDLIEHKRSGIAVQVFTIVDELEEYVRDTRKTFPAQVATAGTVLKYLVEPRLDPDSNIDLFFLQAEYSKYPYNPMRPIMEQFYEMRAFYGWTKKMNERGREVWDEAGQEAWVRIRRAMVLEFNRYFGSDASSLDSWVKLCKVIGGIDPIPDTPEGCIEVIADTHVNILDLLENVRIGEEVHKFESVVELSDYTMISGRIFPQGDAKAGGILQVLLRFILNPVRDRRENRIARSQDMMSQGRWTVRSHFREVVRQPRAL